MHNQVFMEYNKKDDQYTFTGAFGRNFGKLITSKIIKPNKLRLIFNSLKSDKIIIYSFFALELREIIKETLKYTSVLGVNFKSLNNLLVVLDKQTWLHETSIDDIDNTILDYDVIDRDFKYKVRDWAKHTLVDYIKYKHNFNLRGYVLEAAPGTGKTGLSLMIMHATRKEKIIIISPNNAVETVWLDSLTGDKMFEAPQSTYLVGKNSTPYNQQKHIICNYESMDKLEKLIKDLEGQDIGIIVDESQSFKNLTTKRTNILINLAADLNVEDIILASGTPITGTVEELNTILRLLDPRMNKAVENRFTKIYKNSGNFLTRILPLRYKTYQTTIAKDVIGQAPLIKEELIIKMKNSKKYTLDSIKKDMIKYITDRKKFINDNIEKYHDDYKGLLGKAKSILGQQDPDNADKYFTKYDNDIQQISIAYNTSSLSNVTEEIKNTKEFEKNYIMSVLDKDEKAIFKDVIGVIKYPALKIQGEVLGRVVLRARINCHKDMALHINFESIIESSLKKVLVFSNYVEVLEEANRKITHQGYTTAKVYGKHTKDLSKTVRTFSENKASNPLLATYAALAVAVPLTEANVAVAIDTPFREYILNQAVSRAWRDGQDTQVKLYIARLDTGKDYNINDRNIDLIKWYKEEVEKITGMSSSLDIDYAVTNLLDKESDGVLKNLLGSITTEADISIPGYEIPTQRPEIEPEFARMWK